MMNQKTPDLYFAAFAMASGYPLAGRERNGRQVSFVFEANEADWSHLATTYFGETGTVKGMVFTNAIKALKSLVHVT